MGSPLIKTGHVWRGKEALRKKNKAEEHIEE